MREHALPLVILLVALPCVAAELAPPSPPDSAATDSTAADSTAARADSMFAPPIQADSLQMDTALELDVAQLDSTLQALEAASEGLQATDRRVLHEIVAGARELYDQGDVEAARILVEDAQLFLRQRSR